MKGWALALAWLLVAVAFLLILKKTGEGSGADSASSGREARIAEEIARTSVAKESAAGTTEDYLNRIGEGLGAKEIRWILSDFETLGLDAPPNGGPPDDYANYRTKQHKWYLDALRIGLGLGREQESEAAGRLDVLLEEAVSKFEAEVADGGSRVVVDGKAYVIINGYVLRKFISAEDWLSDEAYAPWELCELTESQREITWNEVIMSHRSEDSAILREIGQDWMSLGGAIRTLNRMTGEQGFGDFPTGEAPELVIGAGAVFPFDQMQTSSESEMRGSGGIHDSGKRLEPAMSARLLDQVQRLHPAQMRMLLLSAPEKSRHLRLALEDEAMAE